MTINQLVEAAKGKLHALAADIRYGAAERGNKIMAVAVERGLAAAGLVDMRYGAEYMATRGVPIHVAMRVLVRGQRRVGDWA